MILFKMPPVPSLVAFIPLSSFILFHNTSLVYYVAYVFILFTAYLDPVECTCHKDRTFFSLFSLFLDPQLLA